ncbi:MAG: TIGR01620 family protein [Pseudomonadota bacterium]
MSDRKPVVIELDAEDAPRPQIADPVPEPDLPATTPAVEVATRIAAARPSGLARMFWGALVSLVLFMVGVAAYDFVAGLLARNPLLGYAAMGLTGVVVGLLLILTLRELATLSRLSRIDGLRAEAERLSSHGSLEDVRGFQTRITRLYSGRADVRWGLDELQARAGDVADAETRLAHIETALLAPLDEAALKQVEAASRQVATATALVPLALADVVVALTANVRMIRQIAQIYGGRSGALGAWRLTRAVAAHLVATGAVAVGDDLIGSIAGGGVLSKVSRRFGEGVINGALTARVGIAAIEVCRPMPFAAVDKPRVTGVIKRALTGLFSQQ